MKRIHIYEAEPGDWRWDDAEHWNTYFTQVTDDTHSHLVALDLVRKSYNQLLKHLKKEEMEVEPR